MNKEQWNQVAKNYHDEIVSPFFGKVQNPLLEELKDIPKNKSVAEFGCGFFYLVETLAQFKSVHASDFAEEMVKVAKEKAKDFDHVNVKKEDIRTISYNKEFDVIISVNALLMPKRVDRKKSFMNVGKAVKDDGTVFLILPSMESMLYHGMLLLEKDAKSAKKKFEIEKYDLFEGFYEDEKEVQKFYYQHEIEYYLKKAGFTNIELKKVLYPWDKKISDYDQFPKEDPIWDWFVKAKK